MANLSENSRNSNPVFWCSLFWHPHYEVWKPVVGYEGLYEVSNYGRVKSMPKNIINGKFYARNYQTSEVIMKQISSERYFRIGLCAFGISKQHFVHRLIAKAFIDNIDNMPQVNHIDGNKKNNHLSNLEWCTPSYNNIHAFKLGLSKSDAPKGVQHHRSKFTESEIRDIRTRVANGENGAAIGREFGVGKKCIYEIVARRNWKHVA